MNKKTKTNCEEYAKFAKEMRKLRLKVKNGDLSDFEELKIGHI